MERFWCSLRGVVAAGVVFLGLCLPAGDVVAALDCSKAVTLKSGAPYSGVTAEGKSGVATYPCAATWDESGPEQVHIITTTATGDLVAQLEATSPELDVFILRSCDESDCLQAGDKEAVFAQAPPGTYYIVVDGRNGVEGKYALKVTGLCEGVACDDGDPCTADSCDPGTGTCLHQPLCPEVSSITPSQGEEGTVVYISGSRFDSAVPPAVAFNGVAAVVTVWSDTAITCTVPQGATTGCVTVTNAYGTSDCVEP